MQRQCAVFAIRRFGSADGPHIIRCDDIDGEEDVIGNARAGHDPPGRAVPMHRERTVNEVTIGRVTDRPNVVGRDHRKCRQRARTADDIRAGNNAPRRPVPMFHQRLVSVAVRSLTDSPNVICGDDGHSVEEIVAVSRIRAPD